MSHDPAAVLADRLTASARGVLAYLADHPADATARAALQDELRDAGLWTWPTVRALVLDRPECDGRRLLAADWFEGAGEAERAEFVRVQVELAGLPRRPVTREVTGEHGVEGHVVVGSDWTDEFRGRGLFLSQKQRDIWEANVGCRDDGSRKAFRWFTVPPGCTLQLDAVSPIAFPRNDARRRQDMRWDIRRGFVESVRAIAEDWLEFGDAILAEQPVTEVRLTTPMRWVVRADDAGPYAVLYTEREDQGRRCKGKPSRGALLMDGDDYLRLLLAEEWPRVRTWHLPEPVGGVMTPRWAEGSADIPRIGDVVRLRDGSQGILASEIDGEGRALVNRMVARVAEEYAARRARAGAAAVARFGVHPSLVSLVDRTRPVERDPNRLTCNCSAGRGMIPIVHLVRPDWMDDEVGESRVGQCSACNRVYVWVPEPELALAGR